MDLATLIGLVGALIVVAVTILMGGNASIFVNTPSMVIVIAGTMLVTMMKFSLSQSFSAFGVAVKAFTSSLEPPERLISKAVELADVSRKGGILSLEDAEVPDEFMKKGLDLVIDGHDPQMVRSILTTDMDQTIQRHELGQSIFRSVGDVAPAMGMIGTLIGLVQMLATLDDPKQIAPAMAVALLTTLYGAIIANMFAMPIADKLLLRSREEKRSKTLVIDAIVAIQDSQNPRVIEGLLKNYLPKSQRDLERVAA